MRFWQLSRTMNHNEISTSSYSHYREKIRLCRNCSDYRHDPLKLPAQLLLELIAITAYLTESISKSTCSELNVSMNDESRENSRRNGDNDIPACIATVNSALIALLFHWLIFVAAMNPGESSKNICDTLEELLSNRVVAAASIEIIRVVEKKLSGSTPSQSPTSILHARLMQSCHSCMRSPLILATRLALACTTTAAPNGVLLLAMVTAMVRKLPRWGMIRGAGYTPLASVCCFTFVEGRVRTTTESSSTSQLQTNSSSSSCSSSSAAAGDGVAVANRINQISLELCRSLSKFCPTALTTPDPAGLLPLHAALKSHSLGIARHIYICYPYTVPLLDCNNRFCLWYALGEVYAALSAVEDGGRHVHSCSEAEKTACELAQIYPFAWKTIREQTSQDSSLLRHMINKYPQLGEGSSSTILPAPTDPKKKTRTHCVGASQEEDSRRAKIARSDSGTADKFILPSSSSLNIDESADNAINALLMLQKKDHP